MNYVKTHTEEENDLVRRCIWKQLEQLKKDIIWWSKMASHYDHSFYVKHLCQLEHERQVLYHVLTGHGYSPYVARYSGRFLNR